uniref:hypothetical protein n=1 Tax=Lactococcus lactis TaxID=1358 RepID=UPI001F5806C6
GETVVTYDGTPQPAEWGLSVPATVKLDKEVNDDSMYGNAKIAIVSTDTNTDFKGDADQTFVVSGSALYKDEHGLLQLKNAKDQSIVTGLFGMLENQTATGAEPTGWGKPGGLRFQDEAKLKNIEIQAPVDGSLKTSRWLQFYGVSVKGLALTEGDSMTTTISWTATEKTS